MSGDKGRQGVESAWTRLAAHGLHLETVKFAEQALSGIAILSQTHHAGQLAQHSSKSPPQAHQLGQALLQGCWKLQQA